MIERYSHPEISKIWSENNKFSIWLRIEILAAEANSKLGLIPPKDLAVIRKKASFNIQEINSIEEKVKHDVIAFLTNVAEYVGESSRFIHFGMTSSDVLDTALSVQMKEAGELILREMGSLAKELKLKAKKYKYLPMIGRTHGVHAETITLGLKFALWYDENQRNIGRLKAAVQNISVGKISGAVGTFEHLDPSVEKYVCEKLGLRPANVSTQILQRDRHAEYMSTIAIIGSSLDKFATEIRHMQRTEVLELQEPFTKGQKGSSAMPHKKNPVICERISGLARILRGNSMAALENVNLWHERDISHSSVERMIIPDSTMIIYYMIFKFNEVIKGLIINTKNIEKNLNLTKGLIYSQKALLKLIEKGFTREKAYSIIQQNAMKSWEKSISFKDLLQKDKQVLQKFTKKEIDSLFRPSLNKSRIDYIFKRIGIN